MIRAMTSRPVALLWDNDGVLVDTERLYYQATRELLASVGANLTEALYVEFFLRQNTGAWHLARELGVDDARIVALTSQRNARYSELLGVGNLVYPGVAAALAQLSSHYRMAIVTSSHTDHFQLIHQTSELLPHFEFCLTRSDYTHSKPHPEPYLLGIERLGLTAEQCLVIEDSQRGLEAATAAGLRTWVIPSHFSPDASFTHAERVFPDITALTVALLQLV